MQCNQGAGWYDRPLSEITAALHTDEMGGLATHEAVARLHQWGPNALRKGQAISPLTLLAGQFRSLVIWVLIGAALVSVALGEVVDGIAILAIVLLNTVIGFLQEYRAEQSVAALARLTAPRARVVRGGRAEVLAAAEVVCGDLLLLDAGDLVAADARLVAAAMLRTNEAPLTGESQPVEKQTGICAPETPLAERHNMVFLGTSVASGSGRALVIATGMHTEVGRIASGGPQRETDCLADRPLLEPATLGDYSRQLRAATGHLSPPRLTADLWDCTDLLASMERLDRPGSCAPPGARAAEDGLPGA